jgi:hypothetical protein
MKVGAGGFRCSCTPGGFWTWLPGPELTMDFTRGSQPGLSLARIPCGRNEWVDSPGRD